MAKSKQAFKKATQTPPRGALREAALGGNAMAVRNLLARGAKANETTDKGETPLMAAASSGDKDCVQLLLDAGADVNAADYRGDTPLMAAVDKHSTACAELLLKHGAKVDEPGADGLSPLLTALKKHQVDMSLLLISHKANVDQEMSDGEPALTFAAGQGPEMNAAVIGLVNKGAYIDAWGPAGATALVCATAWNNPELAGYLVKKGADLDARMGGKTALQIAVDEGHGEVICVLEQAYEDRQRKKDVAIQKTADGFTTGLSKPFTANKPLTFKSKP